MEGAKKEQAMEGTDGRDDRDVHRDIHGGQELSMQEPVRIAGDPRCPSCYNILSSASIIVFVKDKPLPAPGDFSVCIMCGEMLRFTDKLQMEKVSQEIIEETLDPGRKHFLIAVSDLTKKRATIIRRMADVERAKDRARKATEDSDRG
jgi:hypothetical protein